MRGYQISLTQRLCLFYSCGAQVVGTIKFSTCLTHLHVHDAAHLKCSLASCSLQLDDKIYFQGLLDSSVNYFALVFCFGAEIPEFEITMDISRYLESAKRLFAEPAVQSNSHPYYPIGLPLPGYQPLVIPFDQILGAFFGTAGLLLIVVWALSGAIVKKPSVVEQLFASLYLQVNRVGITVSFMNLQGGA